jgi:copper chaperone
MSGTATFRVAGMTCAHCVSSVTEELTGIDGVLGVEVALESGEVTVTEAGYALG